ncbi:MAG: hypothetical protein AAB331_02415 [Planctomycetota bacterium]
MFPISVTFRAAALIILSLPVVTEPIGDVWDIMFWIGNNQLVQIVQPIVHPFANGGMP